MLECSLGELLPRAAFMHHGDKGMVHYAIHRGLSLHVYSWQGLTQDIMQTLRQIYVLATPDDIVIMLALKGYSTGGPVVNPLRAAHGFNAFCPLWQTFKGRTVIVHLIFMPLTCHPCMLATCQPHWSAWCEMQTWWIDSPGLHSCIKTINGIITIRHLKGHFHHSLVSGLCLVIMPL